MKLASKLNKFCKKCGIHTSHKVKKVKKGKVSALAWISRQKVRYGGAGNKGKFSKRPTKRNKNAKRPHIVMFCGICDTGKNLALKRASKCELV